MSLDITYSQNNLRSSSLVSFLLGKTSISPGDTVVDIGAGQGIITQSLLELGASVISIEKDKRLAVRLKNKYTGFSRVKIEEIDFLTYNPPKGNIKVFSNIPFNQTARTLKKILFEDQYNEAYLILQKEAAEKYLGQPHNSETLLSLQLKPFFEFKTLYTLKPEDFVPVPKVTSVLMSIKRREEPLVKMDDSQLYKEFVTYGFIQYKPNLVSAYENIFEQKQTLELMKSLSFSKETKLTSLDLEQWIKLFNFFNERVDDRIKSKVFGSIKKLQSIQGGLTKIHRTRKR